MWTIIEHWAAIRETDGMVHLPQKIILNFCNSGVDKISLNFPHVLKQQETKKLSAAGAVFFFFCKYLAPV